MNSDGENFLIGFIIGFSVVLFIALVIPELPINMDSINKAAEKCKDHGGTNILNESTKLMVCKDESVIIEFSNEN